MRLLLLMVVVWGVAGCSKPWVRPYAWTDERAALAELSARAEKVKSVRAACGLTLTDANGESVNFDGAINVRVDERGVWLRLRAWKLSHTAFDMTVRPDGVWVYTPESAAERRAASGMGEVDAGQVARAWSLFMGGFFEGAEVADRAGDALVVSKNVDGAVVECTVDRLTLTAREYVIRDDAGVVRQRLELWQYRERGPEGVPFPMRVRASGEGGSVEVRLEDVELNPLLEESVFTPARRAVKQ
jgi:hypothetical protein